MTDVPVEAGGSGALTEFSVQTAVEVKRGAMRYSSNGGTSFLNFTEGSKFIVSAGITLTYENASGTQELLFTHMAI